MGIKQLLTNFSIVIVALTIASCNDEKIVEPEVSVFEYYFTDAAGITYSSSEFMFWMERVDINPTVYEEGGRIWVKGSEDIKNTQDNIDEFIDKYNEKMDGFGSFSYTKYTPFWNPDAGTKVTDITKTPATPLHDEISNEDLQELESKLLAVIDRHKRSMIPQEVITEFLFKKFLYKRQPVLLGHVMYAAPVLFMLVFDYRTRRGVHIGEYIACVDELMDTLNNFCVEQSHKHKTDTFANIA